MLLWFHLSRLFFPCSISFFFFTAPATTEIYTLSLHDALPIFYDGLFTKRTQKTSFKFTICGKSYTIPVAKCIRSEEHTSELQSRGHLVCRLLLEKKKQNNGNDHGTEQMSGLHT